MWNVSLEDQYYLAIQDVMDDLWKKMCDKAGIKGEVESTWSNYCGCCSDDEAMEGWFNCCLEEAFEKHEEFKKVNLDKEIWYAINRLYEIYLEADAEGCFYRKMRND